MFWYTIVEETLCKVIKESEYPNKKSEALFELLLMLFMTDEAIVHDKDKAGLFQILDECTKVGLIELVSNQRLPSCDCLKAIYRLTPMGEAAIWTFMKEKCWLVRKYGK